MIPYPDAVKGRRIFGWAWRSALPVRFSWSSGWVHWREKEMKKMDNEDKRKGLALTLYLCMETE